MTPKQKQWQLRLLGYYAGNIDGDFGPKSKNATLAFQKDFFPDKIAWDGIFGPNTEAKSKEIIDAIQDVVTAYVDTPLVNDGLAGSNTMEAVKAYQRVMELPVTGIVDAETYKEIRQWVGPTPNTTPITPDGPEIDQVIWNFLLDNGLSAAGAAGLMGNLEAESALKPTNLQNTYEAKLGYTDESYTKAVDDGVYTNFAKDCAGYGLAQWTYHTRKAALLAYCSESGKSVGSLEAQLEFLYKELSENYKSLLEVLITTKSVKEASDLVLTQFERPANMSDSVKAKRAAFGQTFFDKFAYPPTIENNSESWWDEIEYFTREEFKCKCGGRYCNGYPAEMKEAVVRIANNARKHFGRAGHIISGLRCQIHNANEGGVANSQHMYGEAIDLRIDGTNADQLLAFIKTQSHRYAYKINGTNVHVDIPKGTR